MEQRYYTRERNVQIVIALLKAHGIRRVIASPGTTNMTFVVSVQNDPWFQVWSSVDERSAAYLACGMASETGEPVVISCTGATASRNYMPGLTEAYYRKLPVLAITSTRGNHQVGHLVDQQIDRRNLPNDIAMESVTVPMVKDEEDEHTCMVEVNKAILALSLNGGGPSHINLYTRYSKDFSVKELPAVNVIHRHTAFDELPSLPHEGRVAVFVGSHQPFTERQTKAIDRFCATHDAVVFCDHTSGYQGKYRVSFQLVCSQQQSYSVLRDVNLMIHIGEVSGDGYHPYGKHTWRVSLDGALRDTFKTLRRVFMMPEEYFFEHYSTSEGNATSYLDACRKEEARLLSHLPELPFSNLWMAQQLSQKLPEGCVFHMGIYHSLRSYNFFALNENVSTRCNVGGFGIDGGVSTFIGSALVSPEKIHIGVFGDLAFFYDMNVVGNRHVGNNVRLLLVNNGKGNEFRNYNHPCYFLGDEADEFVAAAGHYGNQSSQLVKHYASDLGYEYMAATDKASFSAVLERFLTPEVTDRPMLLEVFTHTEEESKALEDIMNFDVNLEQMRKAKIKSLATKVIGQKGVQLVKSALGK